MEAYRDDAKPTASRPVLRFWFCLSACLLAACQRSSNNQSSGTSGTIRETAGRQRAGTGGAIKIGVITAPAGPYVVTGASLRVATNMVVSDHERHGGINGHKLEPVLVDAKGDPALALTLAQQFVQQDHVDVLLGAAAAPSAGYPGFGA